MLANQQKIYLGHYKNDIYCKTNLGHRGSHHDHFKIYNSHHKGDTGHKKILATEEVITDILKVFSATTKAIDSPVLLLEANLKYVLNIIIIGIGGA